MTYNSALMLIKHLESKYRDREACANKHQHPSGEYYVKVSLWIGPCKRVILLESRDDEQRIERAIAADGCALVAWGGR